MENNLNQTNPEKEEKLSTTADNCVNTGFSIDIVINGNQNGQTIRFSPTKYYPGEYLRISEGYTV